MVENNNDDFIEIINKDINKIEKLIDDVNITNKKIKILRKLKYSLCFFRLILPYVCGPALLAVLFSSTQMTPFIIDDYNITLKVKEEMDSFGNKRYYQTYKGFGDAAGSISFKDKWVRNEDGTYSRNIKTYSIGKVELDNVRKIVEDNEITSLEEIFGKPNDEMIEIGNNISLEEMSSPASLEAVVYYADKDTVKVYKETIGENIYTSLIYIVFSMVTELPAIAFRNNNHFNFSDRIDNINNSLPLSNVEELRKKLEIKEENQERILR